MSDAIITDAMLAEWRAPTEAATPGRSCSVDCIATYTGDIRNDDR